MSLIPLLLGRLSAARAPITNSAGRYDPGAGHRPVAAIVAVALPAALLVAVALSPFELPTVFAPPYGPTKVKTIPLDPPKPDPEAKPQVAAKSVVATVPTPLPPVTRTSTEVDRPNVPVPQYTGPEIGTGTSTTPVVESRLVPVPPLIPAKLDPRFERSFQPDYPASEQRREIEGNARVRVGTDGRVKEVVDLGTASPGFFAETQRRALAKWQFIPATRGGAAEESWFTITVRFQLSS